MSVILLVIVVVIIIILIIGLHQKTVNAVCLSKKRLEGKTVLVTGGTAGMGLEMAIDLAQRGARIIVACPFKKEGLNAVQRIIEESENENVLFKLLDLSSLDSVRMFAKDILATEDRMDILINNAGVGTPCDLLTENGMHFVMQVNYYGTLLLTFLLLPLLIKTGKIDEPSKIIMTTSRLHILGQIDFENFNKTNYWFRFQLYANSKLCLTMFVIELAKRLKDHVSCKDNVSNVVVNCVQPGIVGTKIFDSVSSVMGIFITYLAIILFKTPWYGAQTSLYCALDKKASKVSGAYFANCRLDKAPKRAYNEKSRATLWTESMKLVNLSENEVIQLIKPL